MSLLTQSRFLPRQVCSQCARAITGLCSGLCRVIAAEQLFNKVNAAWSPLRTRKCPGSWVPLPTCAIYRRSSNMLSFSRRMALPQWAVVTSVCACPTMQSHSEWRKRTQFLYKGKRSRHPPRAGAPQVSFSRLPGPSPPYLIAGPSLKCR